MLNKTPSETGAATASAPKRPIRMLALATLLLLFGIYLLLLGIKNVSDNKKLLITPSGNRLQAEVVDTPAVRQRGLSGRASLGTDEAMLFVFETPSEGYCFWMKDMNFPIDMVWLGEDKRVVHVEANVDPSTYPTSFCPGDEALYVIEVQSGAAARHKFEKGSLVRF